MIGANEFFFAQVMSFVERYDIIYHNLIIPSLSILNSCI